MAGRPKIKIDWKEVDKYLICGCSGAQVAASLGICDDTLFKRCIEEKKMNFSDYSAKKRQKGNALLHATQFQVARSGNTSMLIWLGKQRLEQKENPQSAEKFDGTLGELLDAIKNLKQDKQEKKND